MVPAVKRTAEAAGTGRIPVCTVQVNISCQVDRFSGMVVAVTDLLNEIGKTIRRRNGHRAAADTVAAAVGKASAPRVSERYGQFQQRDQPDKHENRKQNGNKLFTLVFHFAYRSSRNRWKKPIYFIIPFIESPVNYNYTYFENIV